MSECAAPLSVALPSAAIPKDQTFPISGRTLKLAVAAVISLVGTYGILSEARFISTSNAVMSAYIVEVRTPIEGTISDVSGRVGEAVVKGQLLGRMNNPLTDHQQLDTMRLAADAAQAEADALATERTALDLQRRALLSRAGRHALAMGDRMAQQVADASHTLAARQVALAQAESELARGRALHSAGILANADFDRLLSTQRVLAEEVDAHRAAVESLKAQAAAMQRGIFSEPGTNNDVAYSQQRADELAIRLAENARALSTSQAQARQAHLAATHDEGRDALLAASELRAPGSGILWKIDALSGEHLASAQGVLSIVDCDHQFLLAEIPQDRLFNVVLNGQARIRFAGEAFERTGTILSVSEDPQRDLDRKLAAVPLSDRTRELATVIISVDTGSQAVRGSSGCLVGRSARVRIPTSGGNPLARWISERM